VATHSLSDIALLSQLLVYVDQLHNLMYCYARGHKTGNWAICRTVQKLILFSTGDRTLLYHLVAY